MDYALLMAKIGWNRRAELVLGAVTLDLANPQGDVVTTATAPTPTGACTAIGGWSNYDEFGAPTSTTIAQTGTADAAGYGWLGAKQRSTTTASAGLTLMGDRYYNATTGRFTSLDPVPGGNANTYTYPTDPINNFDLNGRWGWGWVSSAWHQTATIVHYHYQHAVIGFSICSYACGSVEFQGANVSLGWGNMGVGLGAYAGWNTQRVHASTRDSYSMSVGGGYAVSGTYTWGSNASHTQHHWGQAEFTGGLGGGLWGGAGYSHTWKIGWGKWSVI